MVRVRRIAIALWKIFVGAVFCQFLLMSVLVVGWVYRAMRRRAIAEWSKESTLSPSDMEALKRSDPVFRAHSAWPNWFFQQRSVRESTPQAERINARARQILNHCCASFIANARIGIAGIANTTAVTLVPVMLLQFGWYAGWDNSFNKGYEQFSNGIALSVTGIVLFLAAMLYLPMAQARQAVTGEWRSFYDFQTVWRVVTSQPVRSLLLAAAFSLVALPINILLGLVQFFDRSPAHQAMSDSEFLAWLKGYFFWVCLIGFMGFLFLRMLAARLYASGVLALLRTGKLPLVALKGAERHALHALSLDNAGEHAQRHPVVAATLFVSRPVWRTAVLGTALLVWFTFVAQIYVREFITYHPYRGFLNQPLVQLPWLRYVPAALQNEVRAAKNS